MVKKTIIERYSIMIRVDNKVNVIFSTRFNVNILPIVNRLQKHRKGLFVVIIYSRGEMNKTARPLGQPRQVDIVGVYTLLYSQRSTLIHTHARP